jgi:hypothetical protein
MTLPASITGRKVTPRVGSKAMGCQVWAPTSLGKTSAGP